MEQYGKAFPLGGKAFPFGESGAQSPREVTIFYKSTMKVSPLGGKAFPFGESGAQAPREVTKLHGRKYLLNNL